MTDRSLPSYPIVTEMIDVKHDEDGFLVSPSPSVMCGLRERRTVKQFVEDVLAARVVYEAVYDEMVPTYDYDEKITDGRDLGDATISAYEKAIEKLRELWGFDVVIHSLTSTGRKVSDTYTGPFVSWRFIVRGAGKFRCGDDMKRAGKVPEMFDGSIYKKEGRSQLLRVWGASKEGENRPMQYLCHGIPKSLASAVQEQPDLVPYMFEQTLAQYVGSEPLIEVESDPVAKTLIVGGEIRAVDSKGRPFGEDVKIDSVGQIEQLCHIAGWFEQVWEWEDWAENMWLLRNVANECNLDLRELAHTISRISPKYRVNETNRAYDVSASRAVNETRRHLGHLRGKAREKDLIAYNQWLQPVKRAQTLATAKGDQKLASIVNLSDTCLTDADVAEEMIAGGWVDDYLWLPDKGKHGTMMKWNGVVWETGRPDILNSRISQDLHKPLEAYVLKHNTDPENPLPAAAKLARLRSLSSINSIIAQICAFKGPAKNVKWNVQEYKLGFLNGVLNLKTGMFECGVKEDYLTQTTGYELPVEIGSSIDSVRELMVDKIGEVKALFDQILPEQDVQGVFWQILGSCLVGRTLEAIPVFTGVGRNGKGLTIQFIRNVLGDEMYYTGDNSILQKEIGTGGINQSLANMGGKRCSVFSEGSADTKFKVSSLKHISGGDEINARGIYSADTSTRICSTSIIDCNEIPSLDKVDAAIDARIKLIPFNSRFLTPQAIAQLPKGATNVYPVNDMYKKNEWQHPRRVAMLMLMFDGLRNMLANPTGSFILYNIPKSLEEAKREYIQDSDEFLTWFKTHYHITNEEDNVIAINEIHKKFTEDPESPYANYSKQEKRGKGTKKHFISICSKHPTLSVFYRKEIQIPGNEKREHKTNVLVGVDVNASGFEYGDDGSVTLIGA